MLAQRTTKKRSDMLEAMLMGKDSKKQLMETLARRDAGGEKWQTFLNQGDNNDFGCWSAKLDDVPKGTERIIADV